MLCCFEYYQCDLYAVNNYWNTSCLHLRRQMSYAPKIRSITLFILVKSMCLVRACLLGACMVYLLVQSSMFGINIPGCEGSCIHIQTYCWKKKKTWIIITIVNIHSIALYQCACAQMEWNQLVYSLHSWDTSISDPNFPWPQPNQYELGRNAGVPAELAQRLPGSWCLLLLPAPASPHLPCLQPALKLSPHILMMHQEGSFRVYTPWS